MELPSKILEQISFNTRSRIEEHMLVVVDKSTHEQHLSQPLQTNIKQFKLQSRFHLGTMACLMLQTKIIIFISKKNKLQMKLIKYRLPYPLVLTNSKF